MSQPETSRRWEGRVIEGKYLLRQWLGGSDHSAVFLTEFQDQPLPKVAIKLIQVDDSRCESELAHDQPAQARLLQNERHFVDRLAGGKRNNGFLTNITK